MAHDNKPLHTLYESLKADNYDVPDDYESFEGTLTAPGKEGTTSRMTLYNSLKADNYDVPDTYESFANTLFEPSRQPAVIADDNAGDAPQADQAQSSSSMSSPPTAGDRIRMLHGLNTLMKNGAAARKETVEQTRRVLERNTPKERAKIQSAEMQSRFMGMPTKPLGMRSGLPTPPPESDTDGGNEPAPRSMESPAPYGMVMDADGNPVQQWLLPDGTVTTDFLRADMAEYNARQARQSNMTLSSRLRDALTEQQRLDTLMRQRRAEIDAENKKHPVSSFLRGMADESHGMPGGMINDNGMRDYRTDEQYRQLESAARKNRQTIQTLSDKKNGRMNSFWHSLGTTLTDGYTLAYGLPEMNDAIALIHATKRIDDINRKRKTGEELTQEEKTAESVLRDNAIYDKTQADFGGEYGAWARAGSMFATSLDLMKDIMLTPGAGTIAKGVASGVSKGLGKGIAKVVGDKVAENIATRLLTKATGILIGAHTAGAVVSNTAGIGHTLGEMSKGAAGNVVYGENGYEIVGQKGILEALYDAERNQIRENGSEMFGEFIPGVGGIVMKGLEKIGLKKVAGHLTDIGKKEWYQQYSGLLKSGGYNGLPGEAIEEYEGYLFDALTGHGADAVNELGDLNTHIDIWLGCATTGALLGSVPMVMQGAHTAMYYKYRHAAGKSDKAASVVLGDRWNDLRDRIDATPNERMADVLTDIVANGGMTQRENTAILDYARNLSKMRGYNLAQMAVNEDGGEEDEGATAVNDSYRDGYEVSTPQEMNDARNAWEYQREQVKSVLSDDEIAGLDSNPAGALNEMRATGLYDTAQMDAALDYVNAKATYDGMIQSVRDDIDEKIAMSDAMINGRVNQASGMIQPAVMGLDDRQVYIVGGTLAVNDDGTIDRDASDESIVVRDAETGRLEFTDPKSIVSAGNAIDPEMERAVAIDNIRRQTAQTAVDAMNGTLAFNPGDVVPVNDGGGVVDVTIVGPAVDRESGMPVEGQVTVQFPDGQQTTFAKEQLQGFADAANLERFNSFERERSAAREQQRAAEAEAVRPQFAINDEFTILNENGTPVRGSITGELDGDGTVEIYTEEPVNGKTVNHVTPTELERMLDTYNGKPVGAAVAVPENAETVPNPAENPETGAETSDNPMETVPNSDETVTGPQPSALSRIPVDGQGQPRYEDTDADTAWDAIVEQSAGDEATAAEVVADIVSERRDDLKAAEKVLDKVKEGKPEKRKKGDPAPTMEERIAAKNAAKSALSSAQADYDRAKSVLDHWELIAGTRQRRDNERRRAQEEEQRRLDAIAHDEAVARFEEEQRVKAQKQAEQERIGTHAVNPRIKEKWDGAPKIDGNSDAITLPDGSTLTGRYVLTEAGAASASHDVENAYMPTEGFPVDENGQSVNDRDYMRDKDAQRIVEGMADSYDSRALQDPVIVSNDGVVLSGNNRTMSGDLAAGRGTDRAYVDYLAQFGHRKYGFTPEQVNGMKNPRVVFVPDEALPYDAATFARFNAQEKKSQGKPEAAVKLGKIVPDNVFGDIVGAISRYDRLSDYYADEKAVAHALGALMQAGVINDRQMPEMRTGTALSAAGKELIENTLIGKVFQTSPDAVRQIISVPALRQSVVMGLNEIANNRTLARNGYDISGELARAVDLVTQARSAMPDVYTTGVPVSPFGRMQGLFDDEFGDSRVTDGTVLLLADILNSGKPSDLRKVLTAYNNEASQSAGGQLDMFSGTIPTKEEILTTVNDHFRNATPKEQRALVDAAIAERKRRATADTQQRGRLQTSEQTPHDDERRAEPRQSAADVVRGQNSRNARLDEERAGDIRSKQEQGEIVRSDETDDNGLSLLISSDGTTTFGEVRKGEGIEPLPIKLSEGFNKVDAKGNNRGYGYEHIEAGHGDEIRSLGYKGVETFVEHVSKNYDRILVGETRTNGVQTYLLELNDGKSNVLYIQLSKDGEYWTVNSGGAFRKGYTKNKKVVEPLPAFEASPVAADVKVQEQGDSPLSGNSSSTTFYDRSVLSDAKNEKIPQISDLNGSSDRKVNDSASEKQGIAAESSLNARVKAAEADVNTAPTPGQKEAGNYKKGHVQIGTFDVTIEQPVGSVRRGTDANGKEWATTMQNTYGYIRGTEGVDGDHIDVFLSTDIDAWNGRRVVIVDQYNPDGSFDEHKVMLGFNDKSDAVSAYLANYEKGWEKGRRLVFSTAALEDFEKWIESSKRKTKPFADYKSVKHLEAQKEADDAMADREADLEGVRDSLQAEATVHLGKTTSEWDDQNADLERKVEPTSEMTEAERDASSTGEVVPFSVGDATKRDTLAYKTAKGLVESTGIEVVEVSDTEAREMLGQKNTPVADQPNRANEKLTSRSVLQRAMGDSSSNAPDSAKANAKIQNTTLSAKNNIRKFKNGDFKGGRLDVSTVDKAISGLGRLLAMRSNGGSRYTVLRTDNGDTVAVRLSDHRANGNNFQRDGADNNLSIVIERKRYDVPGSAIEFTEAVIPMSVFEARPGDVVSAIVNGVDDVLADKPFSLDSSMGTVEEIRNNGGDARLFHTPSGIVYGWTVGGKIYLNRDAMNPETPLHEYTHLWDDMVRRENPELWNRGKELMKQTPVWDEVMNDPNYVDIRDDEDAVASEVHSRLAGAHGTEILGKMIADARKEGPMAVAKTVTLVEDIKRWLGDMFKALKKTLGKWSKRDLKELTAEDFVRMTLRDLAEGMNPGQPDRNLVAVHNISEQKLMMARGREDFDAMRDRAVAERGIVMPGLNEASVRVVDVPRHDFSGTGKEALKQAEAWAKANITGTHKATDTHGNEFEYSISNDAVEKYVSKSATAKSENIGVHLAALKKLPEIIGNSVEAEVHPSYKKGDDGVRGVENGYNSYALTHRFYGAMRIDGQMYRVKTTIIEENLDHPNTAHSYEVAKIEVLVEKTNTSLGASPSQIERVRTAKLLQGVEKSYDPGKKLLDASENLPLAEVERLHSGLEKLDAEMRKEVEEYLTRHVSAPLEVISADDIGALDLIEDEAAELTDIIKTGEIPAVYFKRGKKIYIFAGVDRGTTSVETLLNHENIHATVDTLADREKSARAMRDFRESLLAHDTGSQLFARVYSAIQESNPVDMHDEEFFAYTVSWGMAKPTRLNRILSAVSHDTAEYLQTNIINHLYGKEHSSDNNENRTHRVSSLHSAIQSENSGHTGGGRGHGGAAASTDGFGRSTAETGTDLGRDGRRGERGRDSEIVNRMGDGYGAYSDTEVSYANDPVSKALGKNRFSRKRQAEFAAQEHARMVMRIEELAGKLHLDKSRLDIVTDVSQLKGNRAKAKGFYNKSTGKITIVIPNNVSTIDVEQTLLHEAVAHYGLRKLFGKQFDTFLDNVYESADESIRRKIAKMAAQNGWNFRTATEEYLAGLAEDTDFAEAKSYGGWWAKIKSLFLDMLESIGFEGFRDKTGVVLTDNELRYILWRSYENLTEPGLYRSILGEAADVSKQSELKVGNYAEKDIEAEYAAEPNNIDEVNDRFNRELQQQIDGSLPEGHVYEMGMPSKYLRSTGIENLPIRLSAKVLNIKSNLDRHKYSLATVKNLVKAIQQPWAIFAYGEKNKAQNLIIGIEDNGRQFLVGLSINPTVKGRSLEINSIRNVFPKNNHEWVNWINEGKLLRVDGKKEIQAVIAKLRMNPVAFDYVDLDNATKIVENFENPAIEGKEKVQAIIDSLRTNPAESERIGLNLEDGTKIVDSSENSGTAEEENNYLYRSEDNAESAREEYDRRVRVKKVDKPKNKRKRVNRAAQLNEAYLDSMRSLRVLQEAVSHETGEPIEDYENAYMAENHMSSISQTAVEVYKRDYFEPLCGAIADVCGDKEGAYRELLNYIVAKHGLERNEYMRNEAKSFNAQLKADHKNGERLTEHLRQWNRDFSGLTGLTGESDWQSAETAAQQMVDAYESTHDTRRLWQAVNAATKATLTTRYQGGLLSKDVYNELMTRYKFYVPLKGWEDATAADIYEYVTDARGLESALMGASGRDSLADDPLATIMVDAQRTIMEAQRNLMKQKFLNLALNHQTDLLTVSKQWYEKKNDGTWEVSNPDILPDDDADTIADKIKDHETKMKALESQKLAKTKRNGLQLKLAKGDAEESQHVVRVKRNGETFLIYVNGDPRAALAINGMLAPKEITNVWSEVKDFMAKTFTTWNPEFIMSNLARDVIFSGVAVAIKEDKEYCKEYTANVWSILRKATLPRLLYKWEHGTLDDSVEIERYFKEFLRNGGETGYTQLNTVDKAKRDMQRFLKEAQGGGAALPRRAWRGFWNGVEFMNRAAEDTTRFAVYMTSRQQGRSVSRSIHDAKEITVNFNKKGSGALGAWYLKWAYVFFNAAMQAVANAGRLIYHHPGKATAALCTFASAGFLAPFVSCALASLFGDGDDEYWNQPEWVRRNNLMIWIPWTSKFLTIPLPHELRPFYGMGEIAFSVLRGKETADDGAIKAAEGLTGILPVDVTGNGGNIWASLSPTPLQPVVQAKMNVDYFGKPLYRKTAWNESDPEWTKAYPHTNGTLVNLSRMLSESLSTKDEYDVVSYPQHWYTGDINPAVVEHLLESYTGGLGKTVNGMAKTISMLWNEDTRELRNVPVVRKFIQSSDERAEDRRFSNDFFKLKKEYDQSKDYLRKLNKLDDGGAFGVADRVDRWLNTDEGKRHALLDGYFRKLRGLERELSKEDNDTNIVRYEHAIDSIRHELVHKADSINAVPATSNS